MYIPSLAVPLNTTTASLLRIAIQGAQSTGKTWACTTFPNPVFLDFDNKLGAHRHREDIYPLRFWNDDFCMQLADQLKIRAKDGGVLHRTNILLAFLRTELAKFTPEQTVILDSMTMVMNSLEAWLDATPVYGQKGEVDGFDFWKRKGKITKWILEALKNANCNVIVTFHESKDMNADGIPTGKMNPLMSGSMKEQLGQHFTDWYRQTAENELDAQGKPIKDKVRYMWQIKPDSNCNCSCSIKHLIDSPVRQVEANYKSLLKPAA